MAASNWERLGIKPPIKNSKNATKKRSNNVIRNITDKLSGGGKPSPGDQLGDPKDQQIKDKNNIPDPAQLPSKESAQMGAEAGESASGLDGSRPKITLNLGIESESIDDDSTKIDPEEIKKQQEQSEKRQNREAEIINRVMEGGSDAFVSLSNKIASLFRWHIPDENKTQAQKDARDMFYILLPNGFPNILAIPLLIFNFFANFAPKPKKLLNANINPEGAPKDDKK